MPGPPRATGKPVKIREPRLLIGEGRDEVNFFTALLRRIGVIGVQVVDSGGKTNLGTFLRTIALQDEFQTGRMLALGVTRDADEDEGALESVMTSLAAAQLAQPAGHGQIVEGSPRVGVFLLPGEGRLGALEHLCLDSIATDPVKPCLEDYFRCMDEAGYRHESNPAAKARVHAWLASRPVPDLRLGEAALNDFWPWNHPAFDSLKAFLQALFGESKVAPSSPEV